MLEINVLRGSDKVGGNLIEISRGRTKILAELGRELDSVGELSGLEKRVLAEKYDAVIITHYHADHAGLTYLKSDCPVYMGEKTRDIMGAIEKYNGISVPQNRRVYAHGVSFDIGGITVTPYLCDHSAFDSYMLYFEADGDDILYTGDFRFTGRKNGEKLMQNLPKNVKTLIYEGTNLKKSGAFMTERRLENLAKSIMCAQRGKPVFVLQSSANIDRLVSFYRASKRSGRVFYLDAFASGITNRAGGSIPCPDRFPDVFAFTPRVLSGERYEEFAEYKNRRGVREIARDGNFTMLVRASMLGYLKGLARRMDLSGATLIYSLWRGYEDKPDMREFLDGVRAIGMEIRYLHTSGHASAEDLKALREYVHAQNEILVHTEI